MSQGTSLLDLLTYELPLHEVSSSVWAPLCATGRRSLRSSSTLGRQLADSLITSTAVHVAEVDAAGDYDCLDQTLWQQDLALRCNFLARLPQLNALDIAASTSADLNEVLLRAGTATCGRVTALSLHAPRLSLSTSAIGLACPHLQELVLGSDDEIEGEQALCSVYFLPLPGLRKLEVYPSAALGPNALRSMSCLTDLEHLDVAVRQGIPRGVLQDWTRLTRLTHCELWMSSEMEERDLCTLADALPLLQLTQLRRLALQSLQYGDGARGSGAAAAAPPPAGAVAAALSLLGGLVNLESLQLGEQFAADAPALAELDRLTRLTVLGLGVMQAGEAGQPVSGGHLPALQGLCVMLEQRPAQLLDTLRPLLPLPSLVYLQSFFGASDSLLSLNASLAFQEDVDLHAEAVATECAALRQASTHLAAAPRLLLHAVQVNFVGEAEDVTLSLYDLAVGLHPLAGCITELSLSGRAWGGVGWQPLGMLLPGLQSVRLEQWDLGDGELARLMEHLPALPQLCLTNCNMFSDAGWVVLAAAVSHALVLSVEPPLSAEVVALCWAAGEKAHGVCHLTIE